jgi:hypothetical protein
VRLDRHTHLLGTVRDGSDEVKPLRFSELPAEGVIVGHLESHPPGFAVALWADGSVHLFKVAEDSSDPVYDRVMATRKRAPSASSGKLALVCTPNVGYIKPPAHMAEAAIAARKRVPLVDFVALPVFRHPRRVNSLVTAPPWQLVVAEPAAGCLRGWGIGRAAMAESPATVVGADSAAWLPLLAPAEAAAAPSLALLKGMADCVRGGHVCAWSLAPRNATIVCVVELVPDGQPGAVPPAGTTWALAVRQPATLPDPESLALLRLHAPPVTPRLQGVERDRGAVMQRWAEAAVRRDDHPVLRLLANGLPSSSAAGQHPAFRVHLLVRRVWPSDGVQLLPADFQPEHAAEVVPLQAAGPAFPAAAAAALPTAAFVPHVVGVAEHAAVEAAALAANLTASTQWSTSLLLDATVPGPLVAAADDSVEGGVAVSDMLPARGRTGLWQASAFAAGRVAVLHADPLRWLHAAGLGEHATAEVHGSSHVLAPLKLRAVAAALRMGMQTQCGTSVVTYTLSATTSVPLAAGFNIHSALLALAVVLLQPRGPAAHPALLSGVFTGTGPSSYRQSHAHTRG